MIACFKRFGQLTKRHRTPTVATRLQPNTTCLQGESDHLHPLDILLSLQHITGNEVGFGAIAATGFEMQPKANCAPS